MSHKSIFSNLYVALLVVTTISTATIGLLSTPHLLHAEEAKSLFDRLGGKAPITAVVDEFVNRLVADSKVNGRFGSTDVKRLKILNTELVCMATGGPCKYSGQDMKTSHNGMRISEGEFNIVAEHLVKTLKKFKVPKQESRELLAIIGSLKKDIVKGA